MKLAERRVYECGRIIFVERRSHPDFREFLSLIFSRINSSL